MQRSLLVLSLVAACAAAPPPPPPASPPRATESAAADRDVAAALNDQGKGAMYAGDPPSAVRLFRAAVARNPQPRYLFNLCTAHFQAGEFGDAVTSCRAARATSPPDMLAKVDRLVERIRAEAARQHVALP